ncbi:MAG: hypothetical protein CMI21_11050 [Opitutae bacterium]|nr:hypothetical protein [Opitutae bacterium]
MKKLLRSIGFFATTQKEQEILQGLRDEALREKADDQLSPREDERVERVLSALRAPEDGPARPLPRAKQSHALPLWGLGFACLLVLAFYLKPPTEMPSPRTEGLTGEPSPVASEPVVSPVQAFAQGIFPPDLFTIPEDSWLTDVKPPAINLATPIRPLASLYEELSSPSLPSLEFPTISDPTLDLYREEGTRLRNDLQNGLAPVIESLRIFDLGVEG